MKPKTRYLKFVQWSDEDALFIGYCPDLFPWGGVCHGGDEAKTYQELCELVAEEIRDLEENRTPLPVPAVYPMRDALFPTSHQPSAAPLLTES